MKQVIHDTQPSTVMQEHHSAICLQVPPYTPEQLEEKAFHLLHRAYGRRGKPVAPPIDVEWIAEFFLHLEVVYDDLGSNRVSGAIDLKQKRIVLSDRLDHARHPKMRGRARFTLAHEIAHYCLHLELADSIQSYSNNPESTFYRKKFHDISFLSPIHQLEWQANRFAAELLIPKAYLVDPMYGVTGVTHPTLRFYTEEDFKDVSSVIADKFEVSKKAAHIQICYTYGLFR